MTSKKTSSQFEANCSLNRQRKLPNSLRCLDYTMLFAIGVCLGVFTVWTLTR